MSQSCDLPIVRVGQAVDMALLAAGSAGHAKEGNDILHTGLGWTSDAAMATGAVLSWIPRLRPLAYASYSIGLAAGIGERFVPHDISLVGITRTGHPQDKRQPLYWDGI